MSSTTSSSSRREEGEKQRSSSDIKESIGRGRSGPRGGREGRRQRNGPRGGRGGDYLSSRGGARRANGSRAGRGEHGSTRRVRSAKPPTVVSNFQELLRDSGTVVSRFKVHKPDCSCGKVKQIRSRMAQHYDQQQMQQQQEQQDPDETNKNGSTLLLSNAFVVLPDSKTPTSLFAYEPKGTSFQQDPRAVELQLRDAIFLSLATVDHASTKVSCAACLLEDEEPNGFVCVSSPSRKLVDLARDTARQLAKEKSDDALHSDHAHYICTLPRRLLWQVYDRSKTRSQSARSTEECLEHLGFEGVPTDTGRDSVKLQHHLTSVLRISRDDVDANTAYWMVIVYRDDDTDNSSSKNKNQSSWSLDLPRG